ncbi:MAG: hypothetical protein JJ979_22930 [Roseibium sp.]|nr:hypothetical protein [Roseibium sp.]
MPFFKWALIAALTFSALAPVTATAGVKFARSEVVWPEFFWCVRTQETYHKDHHITTLFRLVSIKDTHRKTPGKDGRFWVYYQGTEDDDVLRFDRNGNMLEPHRGAKWPGFTIACQGKPMQKIIADGEALYLGDTFKPY